MAFLQKTSNGGHVLGTTAYKFLHLKNCEKNVQVHLEGFLN
jgi:hypothetical protein